MILLILIVPAVVLVRIPIQKQLEIIRFQCHPNEYSTRINTSTKTNTETTSNDHIVIEIVLVLIPVRIKKRQQMKTMIL